MIFLMEFPPRKSVRATDSYMQSPMFTFPARGKIYRGPDAHGYCSNKFFCQTRDGV